MVTSQSIRHQFPEHPAQHQLEYQDNLGQLESLGRPQQAANKSKEIKVKIQLNFLYFSSIHFVKIFFSFFFFFYRKVFSDGWVERKTAKNCLARTLQQLHVYWYQTLAPQSSVSLCGVSHLFNFLSNKYRDPKESAIFQQ